MDEIGIELFAVLRTIGPPGVGVWVFLWLLRRGDTRDDAAIALQRENLEELRRQRDYYRQRAETAEAELSRRADTDEIPIIRPPEEPT